MVVASLTAVSMASAILALSKASWRQGSILSNLDQETSIVNSTVRELAEELKSLGNACDILYADLEELVTRSQTASSLPYDPDGQLWACLATQMEETSQAIQRLEHVLRSFRGNDVNCTSQAQYQRNVDLNQHQTASIRTQICRNTENLQITHLLVKT